VGNPENFNWSLRKVRALAPLPAVELPAQAPTPARPAAPAAERAIPSGNPPRTALPNEAAGTTIKQEPDEPAAEQAPPFPASWQEDMDLSYRHLLPPSPERRALEAVGVEVREDGTSFFAGPPIAEAADVEVASQTDGASAAREVRMASPTSSPRSPQPHTQHPGFQLM
jgi:hypothetical protein